jgi:RNA polymerase sigma factor (sigma-70 family)
MNTGVYKKTVSERTLDHWYRMYTPLLHHKLRKYRLNTHEREDIVHEAWCTILCSGYDGGGVFASYISLIAERKAIDHLRRQKRTKTQVLDDEAHAVHGVDHVAIEYTRRALQFMCLQLSLSQQMAYITIEYAGRSYSEASELLDAPVATLKTRVRRATALLRAPARYSTYPCSVALPVGYLPTGKGWRMLSQEAQEYSLFTRDGETRELEVVCRYESA